jgi:predicted transcriptional regulator
MKRTTIFADDDVLVALKRLSQREKKSLAQVMREAFEAHVSGKRAPSDRLPFAGKFASGRGDVAERHEELLWPGRK